MISSNDVLYILTHLGIMVAPYLLIYLSLGMLVAELVNRHHRKLFFYDVRWDDYIALVVMHPLIIGMTFLTVIFNRMRKKKEND